MKTKKIKVWIWAGGGRKKVETWYFYSTKKAALSGLHLGAYEDVFPAEIIIKSDSRQ